MNISEIYQRELSTRGFQSDPAQLQAIAALEQCAQEWTHYKSKRSNTIKKLIHHPDIPKGVYMYGGVGRGKSFLMDCFYEAVPIQRKTRLHFHEFMREVHRELTRLQGTQNPLSALGKQIAERFKLICFDEFHVADVTDAMILHRLLESLFHHGVGFVTTSNFHPDHLYPDGLHRDRILPAIALLKQQLHIVNVDNGTDYRQRDLEKIPIYLCPADPHSNQQLEHYWQNATEYQTQEKAVFELLSRHMQARRRSAGMIWFDFQELCAKPYAQNDYLELASQFHTIIVSDVPQMTPAMASVARRFTLLVDVLYDRRVKLILSAAVPPQQLYTQGQLAHEFTRTVSRLEEMQSAEYQALPHRQIDVSIT